MYMLQQVRLQAPHQLARTSDACAATAVPTRAALCTACTAAGAGAASRGIAGAEKAWLAARPLVLLLSIDLLFTAATVFASSGVVEIRGR
jgi:hypothetical protein